MGNAPASGASRLAFTAGVREPCKEPLERPAVDDAIGGYGGHPRVCQSGVGIRQLSGGVRVAVESEVLQPSSVRCAMKPSRVTSDVWRISTNVRVSPHFADGARTMSNDCLARARRAWKTVRATTEAVASNCNPTEGSR
jgi:hypothetical protein